MHPNPRRIVPIVIGLAAVGTMLLATAGCSALSGNAAEPLAASGLIETVEVNVAPELGGRVSAVLAQEGQTVRAGDVLVQFDTALLEARQAQAQAALAAAQASFDALQAGPSTDQGRAAIAQAQLQLLQAQQALDDLHDLADLARAEAQLAVANAADALFDEERDLSGVRYPDLQDYQDDLSDAQDRLTNALAAGEVNDIGTLGVSIQAAQDVVEHAQDRLGEVQTAEAGCGGCDPDRLNQAQDNLNGALNNLEALQLQQQTAQIGVAQEMRNAQEAVDEAQRYLNAALAGPNARDVAIAEGEVAVAQARLARAQADLAELGDGPDPDALAAAEAQVTAARAALTAAQTGASPQELAAAQAQVDVAQAALAAVQTQIAKLTLTAPVDGVVLARSVEPGEVANPGATVFVLGQLADLTITVYVPEDQYGAISLGQAARVSVDSFPGETFTAEVVHIADQAEFTPRNVQTASGRKTTVFAVKLAIGNADGRLKPGMPADVDFGN